MSCDCYCIWEDTLEVLFTGYVYLALPYSNAHSSLKYLSVNILGGRLVTYKSFIVIFLPLFFLAQNTLANGTLNCGLKPLAKIGCTVGRCIDERWEQVCNSAPTLSCGLKPLAKLGCRIVRCVNGQWEQICS